MTTPRDHDDPATAANPAQTSVSPAAGGVAPPSGPGRWRRPAAIGAIVLVVLVILIALF